ncbi:Aquaporin Z 2 [archaeon HR06]|nr:Aquaporin Z 2 [archaeon HR06]
MIRAYISELIATYALVLLGTLSVTVSIVWFKSPPLATLLIGFTHGLVIAVMIYSIGHISGGHINPAVTIALMATKKISLFNGIMYIIFQLLGAFFGALTHALLLPIGKEVHYGLNLPGTDPTTGHKLSDFTVFGIEIILTFFLIFVIFGTVVSGKAPIGWGGFAIGMTITLDHFIGIPLTGASMNPARTFGPAIVSALQGLPRAFDAHWAYWLGPIIGGLIAALIYYYILMK